jgi:hypothetical protein
VTRDCSRSSSEARDVRSQARALFFTGKGASGHQVNEAHSGGPLMRRSSSQRWLCIGRTAALCLVTVGVAAGCGGSPVSIGEQAPDGGGGATGSSTGAGSGASSGSGAGSSSTGQASGDSNGSGTSGAGSFSGTPTSGNPTSGSAAGSGQPTSGSSAGASSGVGPNCGTLTCASDQLCTSMVVDTCCNSVPYCQQLPDYLGPGPVCIPAAGCGSSNPTQCVHANGGVCGGQTGCVCQAGLTCNIQGAAGLLCGPLDAGSTECVQGDGGACGNPTGCTCETGLTCHLNASGGSCGP